MEGASVSATGAPSRTAMMAAVGRGWHLYRHGPRAVLSDWLGWPLVGEAEALMARLRPAFGDLRDPLATWLSARSRFCEDWLAESGAEQYVLLGAGLDSYAWRQDGGVRVFEVDHPGTQAWKRSRLEALEIPTPADLVWAPVDFEKQSVADGLQAAGLGARPTFISWVGVIPYLSLDAITATLRALPPCMLAVSYLAPEESWEGDNRKAGQIMVNVAHDAGEPLMSTLTPDEAAATLAECGFTVLQDVGSEDVEARYGLPATSTGNERIALARREA